MYPEVSLIRNKAELLKNHNWKAVNLIFFVYLFSLLTQACFTGNSIFSFFHSLPPKPLLLVKLFIVFKTATCTCSTWSYLSITCFSHFSIFHFILLPYCVCIYDMDVDTGQNKVLHTSYSYNVGWFSVSFVSLP